MPSKVPNKLVACYDCNQGAVRAVRYNGIADFHSQFSLSA